MRFFKLTHPNYDSDRAESSRNPVSSTASHRLPGIKCTECGPWSSSERLRVAIPADDAEFLGVRFLGVDEWKDASAAWAPALGVAEEALAPGAKVGPPQGTCASPIQEECVHPILGEIWVASRVREAFVDAGLSGVSFAPVELSGDSGDAELWELVVTGLTWRTGSTEDGLRVCSICGRRAFPRSKMLTVDESRWDGSDFVTLDHNPNIILVSERVAEVLEANSFSNLVAVPIP